jgi:GAF domain-containing protein/HAMP domain-containing protein
MSIYQFNRVAEANQTLEQEVQRLLAAQALAQTNLELALAIDKGILLEEGDQFVVLVGPALDKLERQYELFRGPIPGTTNLDLAVASVRGVVRPMIRQAETGDWDHLRVTRFHRIDDKITKMSQAVGEIVEATRANQALALAQVITAQQTVYSYVIGSLILALLLSVYTIYSTLRSITRSVGSLSTAASRLAVGELDRRIVVESEDEIGQLAHTFNAMAEQLQSLYSGLEQRVAERTRDLEHRARSLAATAAVARDAASVLDTKELLSRVVYLVSQQFDFYHTGIFLLDSSGEWAVLQAASSAGGQRMLERAHRLKVGQEGIVGYVTSRGEARIALDVGADAVHFDNPDLPETRSEMALPLRARGEILGALDVQSTEPGAFGEEDVAVLQTLADQVAVAIDNARLFQQAQQSMEAERRAYGELSRQSWQELLRTRPELGFRSDEGGVTSAGDIWRPEMEQAVQEGRTVQISNGKYPWPAAQPAGASQGGLASGPGGGQTSNLQPQISEQPASQPTDKVPHGRDEALVSPDEGHPLAVPIKVRGQVVGVLDTFKPSDTGQWTLEEIAILEQIAEQLGTALESARLYQDTQRRAARERLAREITDEIRRAGDVDSIVRTTVDQLFHVLGTSRAFAQLEAAPTAGDDGRAGIGHEP